MGISSGPFPVNRAYRGWCMALILAMCSCREKGGGELPDVSEPGAQMSFYLLVAPDRTVDILFMVDNSPSMDPKQEALARAIPKMMQILQGLNGGLPDVHIGVVSSDMGAGGGEAGGNCSVVLGNQGILWGNDPNRDPGDQNNKYATVKSIKNAAGDDGCGMSSGARWIQDIQNTDVGGRSKNYKGDISDVLSCLAKAVGVAGCGYEHQLQSLRVALNPSRDVNFENNGFLRRRASLVIVLLSDDDDCSANPNDDTNDGMFIPKNLGETAYLRCAARGHVCHGGDIPNYDPAKGYTGSDPFTAKFSDCDAKDDIASNRDYKKLPLIRIRDMIDSVNAVKDRPTDQISALGIIGWPQDGNLDGVEYRIDKDTTSIPVEQQKLWDYMPICKLPDQKSLDGNIYKAYGGLRLKKFLDAFKKTDETNVFSICKPDYADALTRVAKSIGMSVNPACINYPLVDIDTNLPGVQPECVVTQMLSCDTPGQGECMVTGYVETVIDQCRDGQGNPLDQENPQPDMVSSGARPCWYLHHDVSDLGCTKTPWSMRVGVLTRNGGVLPPGSILGMTCMTCPDGQGGCTAER